MATIVNYYPSVREQRNIVDETNSTLVTELMRDLQSKHIAEKKILENEISAYKKIV
jgi:hypothetical protein